MHQCTATVSFIFYSVLLPLYLPMHRVSLSVLVQVSLHVLRLENNSDEILSCNVVVHVTVGTCLSASDQSQCSAFCCNVNTVKFIHANIHAYRQSVMPWFRNNVMNICCTWVARVNWRSVERASARARVDCSIKRGRQFTNSIIC